MKKQYWTVDKQYNQLTLYTADQPGSVLLTCGEGRLDVQIQGAGAVQARGDVHLVLCIKNYEDF